MYLFSILPHLPWSLWIKQTWQRSSPVAAPQHWYRQWCRPSWSSRAKSPPGRRPRASWEERDGGRMKGWIKEGNWKEQRGETEPFGPDREEIGSAAKKHRENGRTKVLLKMNAVKPDKYRLCTVTPCVERNRWGKVGWFVVFSTRGYIFAAFICIP